MFITNPPRWIGWLALTAAGVVFAAAMAVRAKRTQLALTQLVGQEAVHFDRIPALNQRWIERCQTSLSKSHTHEPWSSALRVRALGPQATREDTATTRALLEQPPRELEASAPLFFGEEPALRLQLTLLEADDANAAESAASAAGVSATPGAAPTVNNTAGAPDRPLASATLTLVQRAKTAWHVRDPGALSRAEQALDRGVRLLDTTLRESREERIHLKPFLALLSLAQAVFRAAPLTRDPALSNAVRHAYVTLLPEIVRHQVVLSASASATERLELQAMVVETLGSFLIGRAPLPPPAVQQLLQEDSALLDALEHQPVCHKRAPHDLASQSARASALRALRLSRSVLKPSAQ